jgi:Flp pilus assembly protein TadG
LFHHKLPALRDLIAPLTRWSEDSVAIYFAVAFFPALIVVGAIVDYSRANNYETAIQAALNAAVLSGASGSRTDWTEIALNTFKAKLPSEYGPSPKPTFVQDPSTGNYVGTVMSTWPTSVLGVINISSINVTATAAAVAGYDNAFVLNLGRTRSELHAWTASKLSGDAFLTTSAGQQATLSEGELLNPGNKIRTGQNGRVLLVRGKETILIASNSVIGIPTHVTQGMSTTVYQWAGSVVFAGNHKNFDVETPYLAAVVKGTQFHVTVNKDDTSVEVLRGQVEVTDFKSGQYALVLPGQAAKVSAQGLLGLSLKGLGTLASIRQGNPRKSSLNPIVLFDEGFSVHKGLPNERQDYLPPKTESEWVPPSSDIDHPTSGDSWGPDFNALRQFLSNHDYQSAYAIFGIVIAGALGAAVGVTAYFLLRSGDNQKPKNVRLAGPFCLLSRRSKRLKRILRN